MTPHRGITGLFFLYASPTQDLRPTHRPHDIRVRTSSEYKEPFSTEHPSLIHLSFVVPSVYHHFSRPPKVESGTHSVVLSPSRSSRHGLIQSLAHARTHSDSVTRRSTLCHMLAPTAFAKMSEASRIQVGGSAWKREGEHEGELEEDFEFAHPDPFLHIPYKTKEPTPIHRVGPIDEEKDLRPTMSWTYQP